VRALYIAQPTAEEATAFGLTFEEAEEASITYVWQDNVTVLNTFIAMSTQWRVGGMGTPIALDYVALPPVLEMTGIPRDEWQEVFEQIRICEEVALAMMRAKAK
jgi:hypothetical protein